MALQYVLHRRLTVYLVEKRLIISLLFMLKFYCAEANNFIPFPFQNSIWRYGQYDFNCSGPGNYCGQVVYKFQGDTMLLNKTYQKLYSTNPQGSVYNYSAAIRQDSLNGDLYIVFHSGQCNYSDTLLYSFRWKEIDTLKQCDRILGQSYTLINNIDSLIILGQWRKRINLQSLYNTELIEGIGSTTGLIGPWEGWIGGNLQLECFELNGISIFPNSNCGLNNVSKNICNSFSVSVYPTITNGYIFISIEEKIFISRVNVELISTNGSLIKQALLNIETDDKISFSTVGVSPGVYFLRLAIGEQVLVNKKIIVLP